MNKMKSIVMLVAALLLGTTHALADNETPLLKTTVAQGELEGVRENGHAYYKGIPFAEPPVGRLRWKAPVPAKAWKGVYHANEYKARPVQMAAPGTKMSEDCLYLNVITPARKASDRLPVLVWIHGGGFSTGCASSDDGVKFADDGIVFVSIEYRVNVFGFMASARLTAESRRETGAATSGNYGLLDQILALKWVKNNIAAFGGDPDKVTIMGESAGGISVAMLCQSPLAKGLFRGAISESGGNMVPMADQRIDNNTMRSLRGNEQYGDAMLRRLGYGKMNLKKLRQLPAEKLLGDSAAFSAGGALWPGYDDYVLTPDAYVQYQKGNYNDVNVLIGTNSDEGSMFTGFLGGYTPTLYDKEMRVSFPDATWRARFEKAYPGRTLQEAFDAHSDIFRDAAFAWPTYAWGNLQSQRTAEGAGKGKVYMYFFDQLNMQQNPFRKGQTTDRKAVSTHAFELPYTFATSVFGPASKDPRDVSLTKVMHQYWVNFIKTGDPNMGDCRKQCLPLWQAYQKGQEKVMYFRNGASQIFMPNTDKLELWEEYFKEVRK